MRVPDFNDYVDINYDKLYEEWTDYNLCEDNKPVSFDQFCSDKFEGYLGEIEDYEYERYKDEVINCG